MDVNIIKQISDLQDLNELLRLESDEELEKQLMEIGYEIKNSVTKKTTCLIVPDRFTGSSSKLTNAEYTFHDCRSRHTPRP